MTIAGFMQWASIALAVVSALCWLRSAAVKVSTEDAVKRRVREAERAGLPPSLSSVSLDGWDMSATFKAQSQWSAAGASFAGLAVLFQAVGPLLATACS
jgi:hypothetical protein